MNLGAWNGFRPELSHLSAPSWPSRVESRRAPPVRLRVPSAAIGPRARTVLETTLSLSARDEQFTPIAPSKDLGKVEAHIITQKTVPMSHLCCLGSTQSPASVCPSSQPALGDSQRRATLARHRCAGGGKCQQTVSWRAANGLEHQSHSKEHNFDVAARLRCAAEQTQRRSRN